MNFSTRSLSYTGSLACGRRLMIPLRGMFLARSSNPYFVTSLLHCVLLLRRLRPFRSVLRAPLLAILHSRRIQRPAHDVIAHAGQVLHAAAAHQHDGVLLQVVADAGNV